MHGWTDPTDPDRAYRRPADDQPLDQQATRAWYDALPPSYDPGDRYPAAHRAADDNRAGPDPYGHGSADGHGHADGYGFAIDQEPADGHGADDHGSDGYASAYGYGARRTGPDDSGWAGGYPGDGTAATRHLDAVRPAGVSGPEPDGRRRLPRPVLLAVAAAAATLALMIGVGVALLPASSDQATRSTAADAAPTAADGSALADGDLAGEVPAGQPTTAPSNAAPAPATSPSRATAPASRADRTTPTPKRTRTGSTGGSTSGGVSASAGASASGAVTSQEQQVIDLVNKERATAGCGVLAADARLMTAARLHSQDQAAHNTMSHEGSDGSTFDQRIRRAGYSGSTMGENVAYGYPTPAAVMDGWMNSPGHRANILNCAFKDIGVGVAKGSDGRLYWTQDFGG